MTGQQTRRKPGATLQTSGILRPDRDGALEVLDQLRSLIRSATLPQATSTTNCSGR